MHQVATVDIPWREQPGTENRRRHEIDERDASPHQCSRALLILQNGKTRVPGHGKVHGIRHLVREHEKAGEDVAGQRGKEKV